MKKFFINLIYFIKRLTSKTHLKLGKILIEKNLTVSTAESCTGGLLSSRLTDVAGSSAYIKENYVTYSYEAKEKILHVNHGTLLNYGAVSEKCAYEMAKGLHNITGCDIALCTTGIAGPTTDEGKPAGMVYISAAFKDSVKVKEYFLNPLLNRKNMKFMFSEKALELVLEILHDDLTVK